MGSPLRISISASSSALIVNSVPLLLKSTKWFVGAFSELLMVTFPLMIKSPVLWLSLKLKLVPFPLFSLTLKRLNGENEDAGPLLFSNSPAIISI